MNNTKEKRKIPIAKIIFIMLLIAVLSVAAYLYLPDYISYNKALDNVSKGDYASASEIFSSLGDYMDSQSRLTDCQYQLAMEQFEQNNYMQASEMFDALGDYESCTDMALEARYLEALRLIDAKENEKAMELLRALGKYKDSREQFVSLLNTVDSSVGMETPDIAEALNLVLPLLSDTDAQTYIETFRNNIPEGIIATGFSHTAALRSDGIVLSVGDNTYGQCSTGDWKNIVSIAAGGNFTLGLKTDGTVVGCGDNSYGQLDITSLSSVKAIAAGNTDSAALLASGQVVTFGYNDFGDLSMIENASNVSVGAYTLSCILEGDKPFTVGMSERFLNKSKPIHRIYTGSTSSMAIYADGTVSATFSDKLGWRDAIYGAVGTRYASVICRDGTIKTIALRNGDEAPNFSEYTDIIGVSARSSHIVALRSDGTLIAFGDNSKGQCNVFGWNLFTK